MFRIDLCRFFHTPGRGQICRSLDQIFFVPSPEPVCLEQSVVTKQRIHIPIGPMGLTIYLYSGLILFSSNFMKQRITRPDVLLYLSFFIEKPNGYRMEIIL